MLYIKSNLNNSVNNESMKEEIAILYMLSGNIIRFYSVTDVIKNYENNVYKL